MNAEKLYTQYMEQSYDCISNSVHDDMHEDGHRDDAEICVHGDRHTDDA